MQSVIRRITLLSLLVLLTTGCSGINSNNISDMLVTFSSNFPQIKKLVFGLSYLAGFWFIISAIQKLKTLSSPNSASMGQQAGRGALVQLVIGALLLALPSFIQMVLFSLWGSGSIMNPTGLSNGTLPISVEKAIVGLMQLLGYISVVRGLMILNKVAHQQTQDTFGKGIIHIIGGILSINIMKTIEVIKNSFGI
jgi:intracellular multiplication protein IcmC